MILFFNTANNKIMNNLLVMQDFVEPLQGSLVVFITISIIGRTPTGFTHLDDGNNTGNWYHIKIQANPCRVHNKRWSARLRIVKWRSCNDPLICWPGCLPGRLTPAGFTFFHDSRMSGKVMVNKGTIVILSSIRNYAIIFWINTRLANTIDFQYLRNPTRKWSHRNLINDYDWTHENQICPNLLRTEILQKFTKNSA